MWWPVIDESRGKRPRLLLTEWAVPSVNRIHGTEHAQHRVYSTENLHDSECNLYYERTGSDLTTISILPYGTLIMPVQAVYTEALECDVVQMRLHSALIQWMQRLMPLERSANHFTAMIIPIKQCKYCSASLLTASRNLFSYIQRLRVWFLFFYRELRLFTKCFTESFSWIQRDLKYPLSIIAYFKEGYRLPLKKKNATRR